MSGKPERAIGAGIVAYDHLSTVGGGGKLSLLSRSFALNMVGIQSPKNHNLVRNAAAKMRMKPNQASHPQPGMINPSTSMITPAPPRGIRERYGDGLLFGSLTVDMVDVLLSLRCLRRADILSLIHSRSSF